MTAQVNLLPSIKQDTLKAKQTRRLIISTGITVVVVAIAVPILLFVYRSTQNLRLNRTQKAIEDKQSEISSFENIVTILTVKDHLDQLPILYSQRVYLTQLFKLFPAVTPQEIRLNNMDVSSDGTFSLSGTSSSYVSVERFFTALKQANVEVDPEKVEPDPNQNGYFINLLLKDVSGASGEEVNFTIDGQFSLDIISKLKVEDNGQGQ